MEQHKQLHFQINVVCSCMDEVKLFLYFIRFLTIQPNGMIILLFKKGSADAGSKWYEMKRKGSACSLCSCKQLSIESVNYVMNSIASIKF